MTEQERRAMMSLEARQERKRNKYWPCGDVVKTRMLYLRIRKLANERFPGLELYNFWSAIFHE